MRACTPSPCKSACVGRRPLASSTEFFVYWAILWGRWGWFSAVHRCLTLHWREEVGSDGYKPESCDILSNFSESHFCPCKSACVSRCPPSFLHQLFRLLGYTAGSMGLVLAAHRCFTLHWCEEVGSDGCKPESCDILSNFSESRCVLARQAPAKVPASVGARWHPPPGFSFMGLYCG